MMWGTSTGDAGVGTAALIRSFGRLPTGWHYGRGRPAPLSVVNSALSLHAIIISLGAGAMEAFPRADGGIVVSGFHDKEVAHVTCRIDGTYNLYVERDDEDLIDRDRISVVTVLRLLRELGWKEWSCGAGEALADQQFTEAMTVAASQEFDAVVQQ